MTVCRARWRKARRPPPGEPRSSICTSAMLQTKPLCLPVPSSGSCTRSRWSMQQMKRRQGIWLTDMKLKRQVSERGTVCHVRLLAAHYVEERIKNALLFKGRAFWHENHTNLVITEVRIWAPVVSGWQSDLQWAQRQEVEVTEGKWKNPARQWTSRADVVCGIIYNTANRRTGENNNTRLTTSRCCSINPVTHCFSLHNVVSD